MYIDDCFDKFFEFNEFLVVGIKCFIEVYFNYDDENLFCELIDYKEIEVFLFLEKFFLYIIDLICCLYGKICVFLFKGMWLEKVKGWVEIEVIGVDNFCIIYIDDMDLLLVFGIIDFLFICIVVDK